MSLKVDDVMVKDVIIVVAEATVREAVELMNKHDIGCIVVLNRGKPVGIVTERDMLKRVLAKSVDPGKTTVSKIMSKPIIAGWSRMDIEDAARLMFRKNIKKLPIVEEGRLIGIVTLTDIAIAHVQPKMVEIIKELSSGGWLPPKRMKKVIDFYIT